MLGKIFGRTKDEVTGGWRQMQNEELQSLYFSSDIVKNVKIKHEMGGARSAHG
jgi:hypothetical protein